MKNYIIISGIILLFIMIFGKANYTHAQQTQPLNIGVIHTIHSTFLNEDRTLNVYLPASYNADSSYPVIYVLDGSLHEDFIHITGLTQFFTLMYQMPESIVIGISNIDRKRDFTFHTDNASLKQKHPTTGGSSHFINFIENELLPFINKTYKTNGTNFIIGQSLGGLLATELLLKKGNLFSHYFIVSPSLWWDNERLLNEAQDLWAAQKNEPKFVYISAGEEEDPLMIKETKKLHSIIRRSDSATVKLGLIPKENHATVLHNSIYNGLLKLFPNKQAN